MKGYWEESHSLTQQPTISIGEFAGGQEKEIGLPNANVCWEQTSQKYEIFM